MIHSITDNKIRHYIITACEQLGPLSETFFEDFYTKISACTLEGICDYLPYLKKVLEGWKNEWASKKGNAHKVEKL